ncbi:MAG: fibronectin type III domain-containing protein, partial [Chloroflexi bacterium]|nr:fibronectin type III domain-containing protein [Chloroflexota bacterium]
DCPIDGTQTKCDTVTLKDNTRDLFPGTYYYYRVAAVNSKGIGPYAYGDAQTAGDWVHAPTRPRLLDLSSVSRTAATVTWIEPEDDGGVAVTGYEYQVLRICKVGETEDCGDWPQDDEFKTTTGKSVRLTGLESGGEYHFRVRAVNVAEEITGKGNWSFDIYIDLSGS